MGLNMISTSRVTIVNPVLLLLQRVMHYLCICYGCLGLYGKVFTPCRFAYHKQIKCKQYLGGGELKAGNFNMQKNGYIRNSLQN